MFGEHVCTHMSCGALLHCQLLFIEDPVSNEVIFGQDLFCPRVVDWVVDEVGGWLAVQEKSHRLRYSSCPLHFDLRPSKVAHFLTCHGQAHVLAFVAT